MNVEYPPSKRLDKTRRQQPHVSGQTNKIHVTLAQSCNDLMLVLFSITPTTSNHDRFNSTHSREFQPARAGFVTYNDYYLSIRYATVTDRITERQHVRSATGDQDRNSLFQNVTSRLPLVTLPIRYDSTSSDSIASASLAAQTITIPTPILNVRYIS